MPWAWSAAGSRITRITRLTPPTRVTAAMPSWPSRRLAMLLSMYQLSDLGFELVGSGARLRHRDDCGREIDVGRVVHLHARKGDQPREHEPHEQDDRPNRIPDAPRGDIAEIHLVTLLAPYRAASRLGLTFWPGFWNGPAERTTDSLPVMPSMTVTPVSPTVPILMFRRSISCLALTM